MKLKHARKSGISLTKNSIVMIVMLVVIVLATMAWFTLSRYSEALNVVAGTEKTEAIMFALPEDDGAYPEDESKYFGHLNFQNKINEIFALEGSASKALSEFNQEITGDGINFYVPDTFETIDNVVTVKEGSAIKRKAIKNQDYVSLTFYVRTKDTVEQLCIDGESSYLDTGKAPLTALLADGSTDDSEISSNKKSIYGDFSKNAIGGAVRVSLIDEADSSLKFIWIPRPDLSLQWKNDDEGFVLYKGVTEKDKFGTYEHTFYTPSGTTLVPGDSSGLNIVTSKVDDDKDYDEPPILEDVVVGTLDKPYAKANGYVYYKFTMNMWLEGSDPESAAPLNGGSFRLYMNFASGTTEEAQ